MVARSKCPAQRPRPTSHTHSDLPRAYSAQKPISPKIPKFSENSKKSQIFEIVIDRRGVAQSTALCSTVTTSHSDLKSNHPIDPQAPETQVPNPKFLNPNFDRNFDFSCEPEVSQSFQIAQPVAETNAHLKPASFPTQPSTSAHAELSTKAQFA